MRSNFCTSRRSPPCSFSLFMETESFIVHHLFIVYARHWARYQGHKNDPCPQDLSTKETADLK